MNRSQVLRKNTIYLVLVFLWFKPTLAKAQAEWGVQGSYYIYRMVSMSSQLYHQYLFDRDTTVGGQLAKVIKVYKIEFYGLDNPIREEDQFLGNVLLRNEGDSVFWWNEGSFHYLYDLSPSISDEWFLPANDALECTSNPLPDQDLLTITNMGTQDIFGSLYPFFTVENQNYWTIGNKIFENIGGSVSLLPTPDGEACFGIDEFSGISEALICYYHPNAGINRMTEQPIALPCEDLAVSTYEIAFTSGYDAITIYPNPTNGSQVYIKSKNEIFPKQIEIRIHDFMGKLLMSYKQDIKAGIDISMLPNGIYFMSVFYNNTFLSAEKIIKQ